MNNEMLDNEEINVTELVSAEENIPEANELLLMLDEKRYADFRASVSRIPSVDLGEMMDEIPEQRYSLFFRLLPKDVASAAFVEMDAEKQEYLISTFTDKELSEMLAELYLDDTVDIIEEMPASVVKRILRSSSAENRDSINQLLKYPKDSAGTIMTTEYVRLTKDMTVGEALLHIRRVAIDKETIYTSYVTDSDKHLLGIVTAKALMLAATDADVESVMETNVIFVTTEEDKEEVALKFDKYGFIALPVVDNEQRLVGIVTVDDAIEVLKEEISEDISKMAAITPTETPYLKTSSLEIFKARIPWLLLLMISATLSSAILSFFEASLIPVLVLFVPMLMDTGGNSGSQSSVTAIRALSMGEITTRDVLSVLFKEIRVGIYCGLTLGAVAFGKVMLVDRLIMSNPAVTLTVAFTVSIALAATIIVAKIVGCTLPLLAKSIGFDPAVMASPFITTIVDAIGLVIYFFISANVFGLTV